MTKHKMTRDYTNYGATFYWYRDQKIMRSREAWAAWEVEFDFTASRRKGHGQNLQELRDIIDGELR